MPDDLCGQNNLVPVLPRLQPGADIGFRPATGLGARQDRIHLRRVDKIDALVQGQVKLAVSFAFRVLLAPGHRTEANAAHLNSRPPELPFFHASLLCQPKHLNHPYAA